ncbi:MAG: hypothetical protein M1819_004554 [Sarea resinae]|nr:MAG: hypothetical protein M1819_004554 [Sarea resinae]
MLDYFSLKKAKRQQPTRRRSSAPVLTDEDQKWLERLAAEGTPPELPERPIVLNDGQAVTGKDAQIALMDGAQKVPLPETPEEGAVPAAEDTDAGNGKGKEVEKEKTKKNRWSFIPGIGSKKDKDNQLAAADLQSAAAAVKAGEDIPAQEGKLNYDRKPSAKEQEDMGKVLDNLNLAAINNRVFSLSDESQNILKKFNQVLKDLINGVPTAYDDLESLLKNSDKQLQGMYGHMPPFLQNLIKSLPTKMTTTLAPEILAAAAEKQGLSTSAATAKAQAAGVDVEGQPKKKSKIPSLKSLVTQQGAVAGMLRSIVSFLRLRWPAFLGSTNILLSVAVFVLLFVFWYCHKRGKEVRLSRADAEKILAGDSEIGGSELGTSAGDSKAGPSDEAEASTHSESTNVSASRAGVSAPLSDPAQVPLPEGDLEMTK